MGWVVRPSPLRVRDFLLVVVDLGALELAREVDVDRLPLGVEIDRGGAGLAVPVAGALGTTEGEVNLCPCRAGVDVENAGVDVLHCLEGLVDILREDRRGKAV